MLEFLNNLGLNKVPVVAGLIGALVSLKWFPELRASEKVLTFLGGWGAAAFGTVPVVTYLAPPRPEVYYGGVGFVLGLLSMTVAAAVVTAIPGWIGAAKTYIEQMRPGGPKP